LGTGAEIALYRAKATLSDFSDSYNVQGNYTYHYTLNDYSETQRALYFNIPLMLQYQAGGEHKFFAAIGGKIGFPISATAKTDDYSISTVGYYGFETYSYAGSKTNLDNLNLNLMASAELGAKWKVHGKNAIYTGIYIDYGINNLQKTNNKAFVQSTLAADNPPMSPIVESQFAGKPFTSQIIPLAVGLKVRFALGCDKNLRKPVTTEPKRVKKAAAVEKKEVILPPVEDDFVIDEAAMHQAKEELAIRRANERAAREANEKVARETREKAAREAAAHMQAVKKNIQQPVENYALSVTELTSSQKQKLDDKIALLQQYPKLNVFIYGHTCNIGSDKSNERVGLLRAQKAKEYMLSKGIAERRIIGIASKRNSVWLVPNTGEENRRKNRRVEIMVQ
jgi:outer membrane protein OmpA-like peptidoglycan-associated protein